MTTAIYPNRIADKERVERVTGLREEGNATTTFYGWNNHVFAIGYNRVVYGDHGPYVEFSREHIKNTLKPKFNTQLTPDLYYEWVEADADTNIKVYRQLKTVANLPNPPKGGYKGNRKEGYADYKVGMYYVGISDFRQIVNR